MNDCDSCAGKGGDEKCMCGGSGHARDAVVYLRNRLLRAEQTLEFYADPDTYFAIAFFPDPPSGDFMGDFSDTGQLGFKPGKRAREHFETPVAG